MLMSWYTLACFNFKNVVNCVLLISWSTHCKIACTSWKQYRKDILIKKLFLITIFFCFITFLRTNHAHWKKHIDKYNKRSLRATRRDLHLSTNYQQLNWKEVHVFEDDDVAQNGADTVRVVLYLRTNVKKTVYLSTKWFWLSKVFLV